MLRIWRSLPVALTLLTGVVLPSSAPAQLLGKDSSWKADVQKNFDALIKSLEHQKLEQLRPACGGDSKSGTCEPDMSLGHTIDPCKINQNLPQCKLVKEPVT